ncbi:hypothetical protein AOCH_005850 [Aspergillus ochraceoroseus]|uniref:Uncharacterized protein n=1 Tax=Aspergillus ochraceoroseus TaxID=138278 RepID=A0A0F8W7S3_9EURO|nr:hypothetical protein AOCH_005850 [Aspergillus ochraceoroseus]
MEFRSRPTDFDARLIRRLPSASSSTSAISPSAAHPPGVSPPAASPPPASLTTASSATAPTTSFSGSPTPGIARSWIITEKLGERAVHLAQDDVDMGVGTPMTVGKFLCHLEEDPGQIAFMRIYYQIPTTGTEDADLATLAQQIQPPEQEEHDLVPGGYIKYLVWEKVPGLPLTEEFFWSLDPLVREDIRAKFRAAYEEMLRCGVKPQLSRISKIIYDQSTGTVSVLQVETHENQTWRNEVLGLALRTRDPYTYGNTEVGDEHGVPRPFP